MKLEDLGDFTKKGFPMEKCLNEETYKRVIGKNKKEEQNGSKQH